MSDKKHGAKLEIASHVFTIIASIITIAAGISAILGFRIFKDLYILPSQAIVPTPDSDSFEKTQTNYSVEVRARLASSSDKNWYHTVEAQVGDEIEFQILYYNLSRQIQNSVMIKDILPKNMQYVRGSTVLFNFEWVNGFLIDQDTIVTTGINIGHYKENANAYVRFSAIVIDKDLKSGSNSLVNWSQAGVGETTLQDYACIRVSKE